MNSKVALVIGAKSQTAINLVKVLKASNFKVYGVTRAFENKRVELDYYDKLVNGNFIDRQVCWNILDQVAPHHIFHFAAIHAGSRQMKEFESLNKSEMVECHVDITRNILEWQRINNDSWSHFALTSQMFSATQQVTKINEKSNPLPMNFYGETKLRAWQLIKHYRDCFSINTNGYILFNHASIWTKPGFFARDVADRITNLLKYNQIMDAMPDQFLDLSSSHDICSAIIACMSKPSSEDYVLGNGKLERTSHILEKTFKSLNIKSRLLPVFKEHSMPTLLSDISKLQKLTEWTPKVHISEVLNDLVTKNLGRVNHE